MSGGREELEFLRLGEAPETIVDEFYSHVLQTTFPADELEALEDIKESLRQNADGVLALAAGRVVGGLVYEDFVGGAVRLVGYLAVDPILRGHGLGPRLLQLGLTASDGQLVLGEIEDPRHWQVSEHNDPEARLRFWARLGCGVLPLPYAQPSLRPTSARVQHLLLIAVPRGDESLPAVVPGRLVADFLREYYLASEGVISDDDAELQKLLDSCDAEYLPLRPLNRLDGAGAD